MSDQRKLVFSSVGDNSDAWESWLDGRRDYEIAIVYYGDDTRRAEVMQQNAEYFFRHKGAKFQNFERYREQFDHDWLCRKV